MDSKLVTCGLSHDITFTTELASYKKGNSCNSTEQENSTNCHYHQVSAFCSHLKIELFT